MNYTDKYDRWKEKNDEHLAEFIRKGDEEEGNLATSILKERYHSKLLNFTRWKLPPMLYDSAEDVVQNTWIGFYKAVRNNAIKVSVVSLLYDIARKKCTDEIRNQKPEWHMENDIPLTNSLEELVIEREQQQIASRLPFITSKLSECERVVWILRYVLEHPVPVIAKLLGKKRQTIYSELSYAKIKWDGYRSSEDYDIDLADDEIYSGSQFMKGKKPTLHIDRFSNSLTPQFTSEELSSLNMNRDKLHENFMISLMYPLSHEEKAINHIEPRSLYMILTLKRHWKPMLLELKRDHDNLVDALAERKPRFRSNNTGTPSLDEILIKVDIHGTDVKLSYQGYIELIPENFLLKTKRDVFTSLHNQKLIMPVNIFRLTEQSEISSPTMKDGDFNIDCYLLTRSREFREGDAKKHAELLKQLGDYWYFPDCLPTPRTPLLPFGGDEFNEEMP